MTITEVPTVAVHAVPATATATAQAVPDHDDVSLSNLPTATNVVTETSPHAVPPTPPPASQPTVVQVVDSGVAAEKLGGICCVCCCDFRRAVIIVNAVIIGVSTYTFLGLFNPREDMAVEVYDEANSVTIDDDQVQNELEEIAREVVLANAIVAGILALLAVVPLYGALTFKQPLVAFGVVLQVASLITEILLGYMFIEKANAVSDEIDYAQPWILYAGAAAIVALFIYPHFGLMMEMKQGIMTPANYEREDYSCCCGTRRRSSPTAEARAHVYDISVNNRPVAVAPAYQ